MSARIVSGIYVVRNTVNGRVYVGSAVNIQARWDGHRHYLNKSTHHCLPLQRAWIKYGEPAFEFEFIEAVEPTKEALLSREQVHLDAAFAAGRPYNICRVAGSALGIRRSTEANAKTSATLMGHEVSPETRARLSLANKGRAGPVISAEGRMRLSVAAKGRPSPMKGKVPSAKHRASLSLSQKGRPGRPLSAEERAHLSVMLKGRLFSAETRAKISLRAKARPRPPMHTKTREALALANTGRACSAETRDRISLAHKRRKRYPSGSTGRE